MSKYSFFDDFDDYYDLYKNTNNNNYGNGYGYEYGSYYNSYKNKFYNYNNTVPSVINPDISYWDSVDILGNSIEKSDQIIRVINKNKDFGDPDLNAKYREFLSSNFYLESEDAETSYFTDGILGHDSDNEDQHSFKEYISSNKIEDVFNSKITKELNSDEHIKYVNSLYDYMSDALIHDDIKNFVDQRIQYIGEYGCENIFHQMIDNVKRNISLNTLNSSEILTSDDLKMMKIDLYKNFYNKEMQFSVENDKSWWFKMLSNMDNYMMKMITNGSKINSTIMANNLFDSAVKSLYEYCKMSYETTGEMPNMKNELSNNNNSKDSGDNSNEKGDEQNNEIPQALKDMMDKNNSEAFQKSLDEINQMNDIMSSLGIDASKAGDKDINDIKSIAKELSNVKINKNDIEKFVKSSIKSFNSAFKGHRHTNEEDFFEAEEIEDFTDYHLLSNEVLFDEMSVVNSRYSMKYDIYVDCSGSMDSEVYYGEAQMKRISLAKILAYKMNKMNLIGDIYGFESHVYQIKDIMNELSANGGTSIDACVRNIRETGRPSIILSDGDDTIKIDDTNVFLFTICSSCRGEGLYNMAENSRAIHYQNGSFYKYKSNENNKSASVDYNNPF